MESSFFWRLLKNLDILEASAANINKNLLIFLTSNKASEINVYFVAS
jgi:hypothetical protein